MKTKYRYYSQHGEDFLLWNLFDYKETGFYVDVGAFDGIHLSNTFSFEQQGWTGICIEPHAEYYQLCKLSRTRAICLNVACVSDNNLKTVEFYSEELGLLSGVKDNREADVRSRYEKRGLEFKGFNKVKVPASTLNAILSKYLPINTGIDFISIDVEGTEIKVLQSLDLAMFQPRVLVIESNTDDVRESIDTYMVKLNGYKKAREVGVNTFYVRDTDDIKNIKSISLNCKLEKNIHPLGEKYTLASHLEAKTICDQYKKQKKTTVRRKLINKLLSIFNK